LGFTSEWHCLATPWIEKGLGGKQFISAQIYSCTIGQGIEAKKDAEFDYL
jgi:hypothetical protein